MKLFQRVTLRRLVSKMLSLIKVSYVFIEALLFGSFDLRDILFKSVRDAKTLVDVTATPENVSLPASTLAFFTSKY